MNTEAFLSKLRSVVVMARSGATEGERAASREALIRLLERARDQSEGMRGDEAERFLTEVRRVASTKATSADSRHAPASESLFYRVNQPDGAKHRFAIPNYGVPARKSTVLDLYL